MRVELGTCSECGARGVPVVYGRRLDGCRDCIRLALDAFPEQERADIEAARATGSRCYDKHHNDADHSCYVYQRKHFILVNIAHPALPRFV